LAYSLLHCQSRRESLLPLNTVWILKVIGSSLALDSREEGKSNHAHAVTFGSTVVLKNPSRLERLQSRECSAHLSLVLIFSPISDASCVVARSRAIPFAHTMAHRGQTAHRDEARQIAANIAKLLPGLQGSPSLAPFQVTPRRHRHRAIVDV
jgi:hypothetical protein